MGGEVSEMKNIYIYMYENKKSSLQEQSNDRVPHATGAVGCQPRQDPLLYSRQI